VRRWHPNCLCQRALVVFASSTHPCKYSPDLSPLLLLGTLKHHNDAVFWKELFTCMVCQRALVVFASSTHPCKYNHDLSPLLLLGTLKHRNDAMFWKELFTCMVWKKNTSFELICMAPKWNFLPYMAFHPFWALDSVKSRIKWPLYLW
jgi:hypothetical protein